MDAEHFIRFHVLTQNICSVFVLKVAFSNLSGIVWTRPEKTCFFLTALSRKGGSGGVVIVLLDLELLCLHKICLACLTFIN